MKERKNESFLLEIQQAVAISTGEWYEFFVLSFKFVELLKHLTVVQTSRTI